MNNDLEQFSEEVLKFMVESDHAQTGDVAALARIALAAKQAKPTINVAFKDGWPIPEMVAIVTGSESLFDGFHDFYTTPPANSPAIPDGWKLVPIQPTEEMINAWDSDMSQSYARVHAEQIGEDEVVFAYQAMLAAAPKPESE